MTPLPYCLPWWVNDFHRDRGSVRLLGQWELLDVVDADHLSYAEAAEVLEGLDVAEARHWVEQLDRSGGETWRGRR